MSRQQSSPNAAGTATELHVQQRAKESHGWREGRPVEDPHKTKRWGFVTAKPSEFLVHVRRGVVRESSGQGATCFKWPWDAVSVIPTSLQQLRFRADQITLERIGVEVHGVAVYRIAAPLLAYRVLNFSYPERAQEKLEQTLSAMFQGAARRLIANLSVEDCLQKRKEALAYELMNEVAPVVSGRGRPDDSTAQGWGIVIDTIEIAEVRVLSASVFSQMQAPFRQALERRAREAKAQADMAIATREAACGREVEEARIAAALVVAERQKELAVRLAALAREEELQKVQIRREVEELQLDQQAALRAREAALLAREHEEKMARAVAEAAQAEQRAQAELAAHAVRLQAAEKERELLRVQSEGEQDRRRLHADAARHEGECAAAVDAARAAARAVELEAQARVALSQQLPALAQAMGQKIGEVKVTSYGDSNPFAQVTGALAAVVDLVKSS